MPDDAPSAADTSAGAAGEWDAAAIEGYPWLYLGSLSAAQAHDELSARQITRILTVAASLKLEPPPPPGLEHVAVSLMDHPREALLRPSVLPRALDFINAAAADAAAAAARDDGAAPPALLVHCAAGVSRSASAVVAWLMTPPRKLRYAAALDLVRRARPCAHPNVGFAEQLRVLEAHGGELGAARSAWKSEDSDAAVARAAEVRRAADGLHADADALDVLTQQAAADVARDAADGDAAALGALRAALEDVVARVDRERRGPHEDRVAIAVLRSARSKAVELLAVLDRTIERAASGEKPVPADDGGYENPIVIVSDDTVSEDDEHADEGSAPSAAHHA